MVTTEHAPTAQPTAERAKSREKLKQEELRREVAATVFLAILIAAYAKRESDPLFAEKAQEPEEKEKPATADTKANVFSLINHAFTIDFDKDRGTTQQQPLNVAADFAAYRDTVFNRTTTSTTPAPEFRPAPSMSEKPVGPQLPNLAFNDRIRPWATGSTQPSKADFAAADRANEMYQRTLFDKGWRGGEATPDEQTRAARGVVRKYHPDLPTTSEADAEAVKMFNANHAKPTTPGQEGPGTSPTSSPE